MTGIDGSDPWNGSLVFSTDGRLLTCGTEDSKLWLWSVDDGQLLSVSDLERPVTAIRIATNQRLLVVGPDYLTLRAGLLGTLTLTRTAIPMKFLCRLTGLRGDVIRLQRSADLL